MGQQQYKVVFQPQGRTVSVLPGTKIIEAAAVAGIIIDTPCGGKGTCKKCKIKVVQPRDKAGECLACQTAVFADMVIEVPRNSLLTRLDKIAISSDMPAIEFDDNRTCDKEKCFGVAVDVGTTTLAASLVCLSKRAEIAVTSAMNPQIACGDDVVSRINHASLPSGLSELQTLIISRTNELVGALCRQAEIERQDIYELTVAGNTTMEHLFCGVDPEPLGHLPFEPIYRGGNECLAADLKIGINPKGKVYIFPVIGGFVGGDTVAGMLATDILKQPQPILFVDIGTNGEIVLVKDDKIIAASTAAGPAFEGAGISCGMRAAAGAIEKIKIEDDCVYGVIGDGHPSGICGSAIIDIAAELLNAGIVDMTGRLVEPDEIKTKLPQKIMNRLAKDENGRPFFVIAKESENNPEIKITQRDIRQVQLAVAAIRAGIIIMLKKADLKPCDLKRVLVAGGFGSFIRRNHAQRVGLLPADIDHEKISFIGNTSLAGAKLALLSNKARLKSVELAERTEHLELSVDSDFQNEFAEAMIFPS